MPSLTIADALRYFFSPFAILFFFYIVEPNSAKDFEAKFQFLGIASALVAGSSIYFLYRYYVYDGLIAWLHDCFWENNPRNFIIERYGLRPRHWRSTRTATRLYYLTVTDHFAQPARPVRASGIHMLYQMGLCAFFFAIYSMLFKGATEIIGFAVVAVVFLLAAFGLDGRFEEEEALLLQDKLDQLDAAAKKLGLRRTECVLQAPEKPLPKLI